MDELFADWYRITTTGNDPALPPDLLERRWKGVEAVCADLSPGEEIRLAELFLKPQQKSAAYETKFRNAFKKADAAFLMQGNEFEVAVLAGVAILQRMKLMPGAAGDLAGLSVLCESGIPDANAPQWAAPLIDEVNKRYAQRCIANRGPATITPGQFAVKTLSSDFDAFAQAFPTNDWARVQATAAKSLNGLVEALINFATTTAKAIQALELEQQLRQEETDILWWMTAEFSRDLDRRLSDVKLPAAALVAGKELADLVSLPGPLAAKSFLDRVLASCGPKGAPHKTVELKATVNALPSQWRESIARAPGFSNVRNLCPVFGAVVQSLATDGPEEWLPLYRKAYQREATLQLSGVDLAFQSYREWLLIDSAAELGGDK